MTIYQILTTVIETADTTVLSFASANDRDNAYDAIIEAIRDNNTYIVDNQYPNHLEYHNVLDFSRHEVSRANTNLVTSFNVTNQGLYTQITDNNQTYFIGL